MRDFHESFYSAVDHSQAHALFCQRVYGLNLSQHGFADLEQLELLLQVSQLNAGQEALDLDCRNGRISKYLADRSGAYLTGRTRN